MEGFHCFEPSRNCDQEGLTLPVAEYGHNRRGGVSVTGGYVYRGTNIPDLYGKYIYGDFGSGRIWMLERQDNNWNTQVLAETDFNISSFGEDEAGELYLADYGTGSIYKFAPDSSAEAIND